MSIELRIIRAAIAVLVTIASLRIYSYVRERPRRGTRDFLDFVSLALFSPHLVYSPHRYHSQPTPRAREIARMIVALAVIPLTWISINRLIHRFAVDSFWLNHLLLVIGFVIIMTAFGQFSLAKWRLRGLRAKPLIDNILLSRTPADFWRRWSWPMHAWLFRYVYLPAGGTRHWIRAVLAVFFISALLHEILAFAAIGRATGHQTIFFMLSGLGVLASPMLERLARFGIAGRIAMRTITLSFLAVTAMFMFATMNEIVPLYVKRAWLMW